MKVRMLLLKEYIAHCSPDMTKNIRIESVKTIYNFGDRVECSADGNPSPIFTWSCDVGTSREGSVLTIRAVQSVLTLEAGTFEVDVNYMCQCTAMSSIFRTTVSAFIYGGSLTKF